MILPPPRSTRTDTRFPNPTLFRSKRLPDLYHRSPAAARAPRWRRPEHRVERVAGRQPGRRAARQGCVPGVRHPPLFHAAPSAGKTAADAVLVAARQELVLAWNFLGYRMNRSEEHTSDSVTNAHLVYRLLLVQQTIIH